MLLKTVFHFFSCSPYNNYRVNLHLEYANSQCYCWYTSVHWNVCTEGKQQRICYKACTLLWCHSGILWTWPSSVCNSSFVCRSFCCNTSYSVSDCISNEMVPEMSQCFENSTSTSWHVCQLLPRLLQGWNEWYQRLSIVFCGILSSSDDSVRTILSLAKYLLFFYWSVIHNYPHVYATFITTIQGRIQSV